MQKRTSNIYYSIDRNMNFVFPEQKDSKIDLNKIAIAISGGGTRSVACSTGYFRTLYKRNKDFMMA